MIKSIKITLITTVMIAVGICSCKKKKDTPAEVEPPSTTQNPPASTSTNVAVNFTNMWGSKTLTLAPIGPYNVNTPRYVNANGDTCSISQCRYYISNIRLKKSDNTYYTESNSYHLIQQMDTVNTCSFNLASVPFGDYTQIEFDIGVDSTRNCSGAQSGALDPAKGMFWNWNQGYVFMQFEGYSNQAGASPSNNLAYHLGGFSAPYNNVKKITINLTGNLTVVSTHVSKMYLKADISEMFKTPTTINFAVDKQALQASSAVKFCNNYADMFSVSAIVN